MHADVEFAVIDRGFGAEIRAPRRIEQHQHRLPRRQPCQLRHQRPSVRSVRLNGG
jgi:hypothetical protein